MYTDSSGYLDHIALAQVLMHMGALGCCPVFSGRQLWTKWNMSSFVLDSRSPVFKRSTTTWLILKISMEYTRAQITVTLNLTYTKSKLVLLYIALGNVTKITNGYVHPSYHVMGLDVGKKPVSVSKCQSQHGNACKLIIYQENNSDFVLPVKLNKAVHQYSQHQQWETIMNINTNILPSSLATNCVW